MNARVKWEELGGDLAEFGNKRNTYHRYMWAENNKRLQDKYCRTRYMFYWRKHVSLVSISEHIVLIDCSRQRK